MVQNCSYFFSQFLDYKTFSLFSIAFAILLAYFLVYRVKLPRLGFVGVCFFVIGGVANAFDRIKDGCVSDYLDFFGLFKYNVYDAMICIGSALLIYIIVFSRNKEELI